MSTVDNIMAYQCAEAGGEPLRHAYRCVAVAEHVDLLAEVVDRRLCIPSAMQYCNDINDSGLVECVRACRARLVLSLCPGAKPRG